MAAAYARQDLGGDEEDAGEAEGGADGTAEESGDVVYADALRQHITAALNEILSTMPDDLMAHNSKDVRRHKPLTSPPTARLPRARTAPTLDRSGYSW